MKTNRIYPAGEYVGVAQSYLRSEQDSLSTGLSKIELRITSDHNLVYDVYGQKTVLTWEEDKWEVRPIFGEGPVQATPTLYGTLLVIEFLMHERGSVTSKQRFYLAKSEQ